ncbi:MAG TPA: MFS transporter [Anaerolineae bacterium]|nr:MFS transporter [Anaerolineae bacterium]HQI85275.1 MFS transporter [Anaerolineae bacterium]
MNTKSSSNSTRLVQRFVNFFGLRKNIAALLAMVILVGMGEKMAERFLPIYLLALGGGTLSVGLLNGMDNLLSALYSFPGGYLSDKLGYKRALLLFNLIAMFGYVIVILFPVWYAVIIGSVFFLSWTAISLPATMSMVSKAMPQDKRTMGVSMHSLVRRIPMALGPVVGGFLIAVYGERNGVRLAFCVALFLGFVALVLQQRLIEDVQGTGKAESSPLRMARFMSPDLRNLLISDILIRFCEQIPYAFAVVWAMKYVGISAPQFGLLTTIEMITAMLIYIPIAYLADKNTKKPFVVITFINFTLFPLVLFFARSFPLLIVAFILRGMKEFGEPTRKALIMDLAPEDKKAGMFGYYYLVRDVIVSLAAFGGALLWDIAPAVNFLTAFGFGVLGTLYFAVFGRDLKSIIRQS